MTSAGEMRARARQCLAERDVHRKLDSVRQLVRDGDALRIDTTRNFHPVPVGWPARPKLVPGSRVPKRGFASREGRAALMHAIAHIEFNAINLALDAVVRFAGMPERYYRDWLKVAHEEVYHFELVRAHLRHLGMEYGDLPAHGGLWEMCERTADDVLHRMAIVPRVLEARGLDVTPTIRQKLFAAGDANAANILSIILRDEVGHVATGSRWFRYLCDQRGHDPASRFQHLLRTHFPQGVHGPFNLEARQQAGFTSDELRQLTQG
ncbi:MAG: DUF455 family protein [Zetaproteobacteria bacterium]|nr:MAG: DUF455 family protein [Zetaproteobacteria bacterium]